MKQLARPKHTKVPEAPTSERMFGVVQIQVGFLQLAQRGVLTMDQSSMVVRELYSRGAQIANRPLDDSFSINETGIKAVLVEVLGEASGTAAHGAFVSAHPLLEGPRS